MLARIFCLNKIILNFLLGENIHDASGAFYKSLPASKKKYSTWNRANFFYVCIEKYSWNSIEYVAPIDFSFPVSSIFLYISAGLTVAFHPYNPKTPYIKHSTYIKKIA